MKRRHVLTLVASAALVLPAGGLWLWARHAENVLAAAQQRCRDAGLPMTIDDIRPPPVPDEDNAALVLTKLGPMLEALANDNDTRSLFRVIDRIVEDGEPPVLSAIQASELQAALKDSRVLDILSLVEALVSKTRFDAALQYEKGAELLLTHIRRVRELTKLLLWKSRQARWESRQADAMKGLTDMIAVSEFLKDEPTLVSQLTRSAGIVQALDEGERLMVAVGPDSVRITGELSERLAAVSFRDPVARALDGERICFGGYVFRRVRDLSATFSSEAGSPGSAGFLWLYQVPGLLNLEHAEYTERLGLGSTAVAKGISYEEIEETLLRSNDVPWHMAIIRVAMPTLRVVAKRTFQNETRLSAARIGLALDRYRAAHGVYPAALAELAPAFLPEVPQDFFSGKAFVYVRDADGLGALVYSVGPNMRDDGGVKDDPSAAGGAAGTSYRDDESWACGAAAKRKFAPPAPAASASAPAP